MKSKTNAQLTEQVRSMSCVLEKLIYEVEELRKGAPLNLELTESEILISQNYDTHLWEKEKCI